MRLMILAFVKKIPAGRCLRLFAAVCLLAAPAAGPLHAQSGDEVETQPLEAPAAESEIYPQPLEEPAAESEIETQPLEETDSDTQDETESAGVTRIIPFFWHRAEHLTTPDLSDISGITFLTDSDYPPFNYRDARGDLVGFNVDIAKALCAALRIRCRIAARSWDELVPALEDRTADAVIASIAITEANRELMDFSFPYFRSPARFVVRQADRIGEVTPEAMQEKRIAVTAGTAHEAYLNAFFSSSEIIVYEDAAQAREAVRTAAVDALFGDGATLMFWINGTTSNGCCRFAEGVFTESLYFGNGAGIAVRIGDDLLMDALNYGLDRIKVSGTYDRIYRKHFPLDLY